MANWQDPRLTGGDSAAISVPSAARDVGLRSYMLKVYNYMASGVALTGAVAMLFWGFATLMGLSMSTVFLVYTGVSIAQTFFAVTAAFAGLSLYGYTTKRDLSGLGTFLIMGVVGILVAMLLNAFVFKSGAMAMAISAIGVLLLAGLTAYDTQRIKSMYYQVQGSEMLGKTAILGALNLYLDFINMFQFLLSFMGDRR